MTFAHPLWLAACAAPIAWFLWERRGSQRPLGLALKACAFAAIFLALAEPQMELRETETAVVVLTDESSSIPQSQIAAQRDLVESIRAAAGSNPVRPIAFDETVHRGSASDGDETARLRATNLESAIRSGLAAVPADRVARLVLASDGLENRGAMERAVYQARARGVPIDVVPLAGRAEPDLTLESVTMPQQAYVGERFAIELAVRSPRATQATVQLAAEGRPLGSSEVDLQAGENRFVVRARLESAGSSLITGDILAGDLGELPFAGVVSLATPRALIVGGEDANDFRNVLETAGFEVERVSSVREPPTREQFELVVADNQDFEQWPSRIKSGLEQYVSAGGGFLLIAGEKNLYVERQEPLNEPLNRMLPATLAPPRLPEGAAVVLVLDKSSSMEGKKMQLARQSAMGMIDNLREEDRVGVLVFDNSHEWAVNLQANEQPAATKRQIAGIIADGGTQIAPALREAYSKIEPQQAVYRHILLLTDGISEEGDSIQLAREASENTITISTIGLGQDVNRAYLERVAETAKGRSYLVLDVAQLAQVVLRDVLEHTGASVTEREFFPDVVSEAEILNGVDVREAGPLLGWVRFEAKPAAETILSVSDEEDPLLVRWQYGLGRSAVFASDAKNRWAANWVEWPGFDRFWANAARDLLPRTPVMEAEARLDAAGEEILVTFRGDSELLDGEEGELLAIGPGGYRASATLERATAGTLEARFDPGEADGLFRFRAVEPNSLLPETALLRRNEELDRFGSNPGLLRAAAEATGGRFNPTPEDIFSSDGRSVADRLDLWPALLALALLLNLLELLARKGWLSRWTRWT